MMQTDVCSTYHCLLRGIAWAWSSSLCWLMSSARNQCVSPRFFSRIKIVATINSCALVSFPAAHWKNSWFLLTWVLISAEDLPVFRLCSWEEAAVKSNSSFSASFFSKELLSVGLVHKAFCWPLARAEWLFSCELPDAASSLMLSSLESLVSLLFSVGGNASLSGSSFDLKLRAPRCFSLAPIRTHSTWKAAMASVETFRRWSCETLEAYLSQGALQGDSRKASTGALPQIWALTYHQASLQGIVSLDYGQPISLIAGWTPLSLEPQTTLPLGFFSPWCLLMKSPSCGLGDKTPWYWLSTWNLWPLKWFLNSSPKSFL